MKIPIKYTSIKFQISAFVLLFTTIALFTHLATFDQFITVSQWVLGLYSMGNIADKVVTKNENKTTEGS